MFWGKNIKSGETYSFDKDASILDENLNITNISLSDALDNTKYYLKITNNGQTYQLCSLDKNKDSISSSLSFIVKKGMKLTVKGGNKGTVSLIGFIEKFENDNEIEEINTDKNKEEKKEKTEVIPQLAKDKNTKEKKDEKKKENKDEKKIEDKDELEEDEDDDDLDDDLDDDDDKMY